MINCFISKTRESTYIYLKSKKISKKEKQRREMYFQDYLLSTCRIKKTTFYD